MSLSWLISIMALIKKLNAQCLSASGSCGSTMMPPLPFSSYIQTFDASSCVSNNQLQITEISTYYQYSTDVIATFDFKMEIFIPSSLNAFAANDHLDNKIASAQTSVTLTTIMPAEGLLQVTFSDLDITLGCNDRYGYAGYFAMFTYPINCNGGIDPLCTTMSSQIWPQTCTISSGLETLFIYDTMILDPPYALEDLDIIGHPMMETYNTKRMRMDIGYTNSIQCTCDTSIEMANGDYNSEDDILRLFGGQSITQAFRTDCFNSQRLQFIHILIGWSVDNSMLPDQEAPIETFTLVIEDIAATSVLDVIQLQWSSWTNDNSPLQYTETLTFAIAASDLYIGCGTDLRWTLSYEESTAVVMFYAMNPFVVSATTASHMANDAASMLPDPLPEARYAAFELQTDVTFLCPVDGTRCLPSDQCPTGAPTSTAPSKTPTDSPITNAPTSDPSKSPTLMPTSHPSVPPTLTPTAHPSMNPVTSPPTASPVTSDPTSNPLTSQPTAAPSTSNPTANPNTPNPTVSPFTSNPTASPITSNPTASLITPNPTESPVVTSRRTTADCNNVRRVISWSMSLLDGIDITADAFNQEFEIMVLDALREAILLVAEMDTFDWCLGLKEVIVVYTNGRRLLATEVSVEATFDYDTDLENEVFSEDVFSANEFETTFGAQVSTLAQKNSFMSVEDDVTNIYVGEAVNVAAATDSDMAIDHVTVAIICIVCIAVLLMVLGYVNSKCRSADDFKYGAVVLFGIYAWDFFSDILFTVDVWITYLSSTPQKDIPHTGYPRATTELMLSIVFGCSVGFIVLPLMKNFYDLIKSQGFWQKHPLHADRYRSWLDQYGTLLFGLSFICGSTFGAVSLVNSNLFGKRVFSMGLSKYDLRQFNQKRLVNVIVGENLPQLVVQIFYASAIEGGVTTIAFAAIASSTLSVCAAVLDFASKKKLLADENVNQTLFSVKVVSTQEAFTQNVSTFKHKTRQLMAEIAHMFPLDRHAVEILPIEKFSDHKHDGLVLYFFISTSKFEPKQLFDKLNFNNQSHLARQIAKAWRLNAKQIVVYDLEFMLKSQDTGHFVEIQLNEYVKQTDVNETEDANHNALSTDEAHQQTDNVALPHDATPNGDGEKTLISADTSKYIV